MELPHFKKSHCGCSLKMAAITIGIIYLIICVIAALVTVLAGATGITIRLVVIPENAKHRIPGRFWTPAPTKPSNEIEISQELTNQNGPEVGEHRPGIASEDSSVQFRPTSLPEMYGTRITTKKPKTVSLDDVWMGRGFNENNPAPDEEDELKAKLLIITTISALTFLLISAFFDVLLIHGAIRNRPAYVYGWIIEQFILLFFDGILLAIVLYHGCNVGTIVVLLEIVSRFYCLLIGNSLYHYLRQRQMSRGFTGRIVVRIGLQK